MREHRESTQKSGREEIFDALASCWRVERQIARERPRRTLCRGRRIALNSKVTICA